MSNGSSEGQEPKARWSAVGYLTGAHMIHDMPLGMVGVLLPFLREHLGFSLFLAGLLAPAERAGSLMQPVLGHVADNVGKRRFVLAFLTLTSIAFSMMGLSINFVMLLVVVAIGGLSSAAYHPAGSALVTSYAGGRLGTGMAIYYFGGNIGLALGPLAAAYVVSEFGLRSTWLLMIPGVLWAAALSRLLSERHEVRVAKAAGRESLRWVRRHVKAFLSLGVVVLGRAIGAGGLALFLPSLLLERNYSLAVVAVLTSGFFVVGGFGGLIAGWLSDRIGRRRVIGLMLFMGPMSLLGFLFFSGPLATVLLLVASISLRGEQPVIMAMIQEWAPERRGTVVGLVLGGQFVLSGIGTAGVGWLADSFGLNEAFRIVALIPLLGIPLVFRLPSGRLEAVPVAAAGRDD